MPHLSLLHALYAYLIGINLITCALYGADKWRAKRGLRRISERALLVWALCGGSLGAWAGMRLWRHKTQHLKFRYGIPLILALHTALMVMYIYR